MALELPKNIKKMWMWKISGWNYICDCLMGLPSFITNDKIKSRLANLVATCPLTSLHFQGWKSWSLCQAIVQQGIVLTRTTTAAETARMNKQHWCYRNIYFGLDAASVPQVHTHQGAWLCVNYVWKWKKKVPFYSLIKKLICVLYMFFFF